MSESDRKLVTLSLRRDLWEKRSCRLCEGSNGEHFRREWGCEKPTSNVLDLGDAGAVDRCPVALFREARGGWCEWAPWAVAAWDAGNFATLIPPREELTAVAEEYLQIAIGAARACENARFEAAREKAEAESKRATAARPKRGR